MSVNSPAPTTKTSRPLASSTIATARSVMRRQPCVSMAGRRAGLAACASFGFTLLRDRQLALYALDVVVHLGQHVVGHHLAGGKPLLALVVPDRPGEGMELAGPDVGCALVDLFLHVPGHDLVVRAELDHAFLDAAPHASR